MDKSKCTIDILRIPVTFYSIFRCKILKEVPLDERCHTKQKCSKYSCNFELIISQESNGRGFTEQPNEAIRHADDCKNERGNSRFSALKWRRYDS